MSRLHNVRASNPITACDSIVVEFLYLIKHSRLIVCSLALKLLFLPISLSGRRHKFERSNESLFTDIDNEWCDGITRLNLCFRAQLIQILCKFARIKNLGRFIKRWSRKLFWELWGFRCRVSMARKHFFFAQPTSSSHLFQSRWISRFCDERNVIANDSRVLNEDRLGKLFV